ncbi:Gfo/Idh/MocA family oxidoreductase [Maridesulfovibrio bastinii]|uniref:Gfo/Idh/MocA family oxidoreductase n=1 Tax=Maridesulfovibrio bastinii TaxID=47157 RepID=UPI000403CD1E|nr:Gfo/Idh/MocA family oxidoreductase [Maridesulfovibrio bastinii]
MPEALPAVCCGTRFGRAYIEGLRLSPDFVLAGILARGSERSRKMAAEYNVPLYTEPEQLPENIKAACVVIRSSIVGGAGTDIALRLLRRGVHVIQEHPMHQREVEMCRAAAQESGCVHYLNTHHVHLAETRHFLDIVHKISKEQPISFINGLCGVQVLCSLLDIIGMISGTVRPYDFDDYHPVGKKILDACSLKAFPYEVIRGYIAEAPVTLSIQNHYDPDDPDNNASILHRITVGFPSGNLTLMSAFGPVIWSDRLHFPGDIFNLEGSSKADEPVFRSAAGDSQISLNDLVLKKWPQAVAHALGEFSLKINGNDPFPNRERYEHDLCSLWTDCMQRMGAPGLVKISPPPRDLPEAVRSLSAKMFFKEKV